jgi:hypothetical protein
MKKNNRFLKSQKATTKKSQTKAIFEKRGLCRKKKQHYCNTPIYEILTDFLAFFIKRTAYQSETNKKQIAIDQKKVRRFTITASARVDKKQLRTVTYPSI